MKIKVKNLGVLRQAEFEIGDMTIICGGNNTGKTYANYALYGFLSFWNEAFFFRVNSHYIKSLLQEGRIFLNLREFINNSNSIVADACEEYTKELPRVLASEKKYFKDTEFSIELLASDIKPAVEFKLTLGTAKKQIISIFKEKDSDKIQVSLLIEKGEAKIPEESLERIIGDVIRNIIFGKLFPNPFIVSAERTGAAIFRKELDFARNRLLEQMSSMERDLDPFVLLDKVYSDYALPVRRNVDFSRRLEDIYETESFIVKKHPKLLKDFDEIIGGEYCVKRNQLYYVPNSNKRLRLNMNESSSSVRSLLDIGFYLQHKAKPDDLLIVDEPELNLHPENQRRIARLFARLVNIGIKVFITTHSDYIIKELNTLIMLNNDEPHIQKIREKQKYLPEELLKAQNLKVYVAKNALVLIERHSRRSYVPTLIKADINDSDGIEVESFDLTINEMNRIQKAIIFGREM